MKTDVFRISDIKIEKLERLQKQVDLRLNNKYYKLDEKVEIAKKYNKIMKEYLEALESKKAIKKLLEN